uniref:Pirin-like protein n=1 Tax=Physcomitrium patens TaxID=3218 RepID=A0A7I4CWS4_PHYPA|nr:pirin-like protein isoform X2 [Physcomitrium patens]|eukprot:XP_024358108.1 pirin-like protein isoform X2 [Physcomitrella patens]
MFSACALRVSPIPHLCDVIVGAKSLFVRRDFVSRVRFAEVGSRRGRSWVGVRAMGSVPADFSKPRKVVKKVLSQAQPEGDGATVRRSIGRPELKQLDPFLLLDYFEASGPAGFPDHPHRGFETVTYMLQWMTAGRGIVHSEMPSPVGVQRGLQLWVNLAGKDKMIEPNYQELKAKDIPRIEKDGVEVVIIAGESFGVKSPVYTRTPTMYLDFYLQPGASLHQAIPEGWNAFTFVLKGSMVFGKEDAPPIGPSHTVVLSDGDGLSAWNKGTEPAQFVLVGGKPLNEPVAQYGPFVMNTQAQLMEAVRDYQYGKNGFERAHSWRSEAKAQSTP